MEPTALADICVAVEGRLTTASREVTVTGVTTDTRSDCRGRVFFALRGERFDGHDYVQAAAAAGAAACVVHRAVHGVDMPQIIVDDTLQALGRLARWYAQRIGVPCVGITGSVGKTSLRSMTAAVLRARLNVLESPRNFNNEVGVPLTLLELASTHDVAVIEMAMRGQGQIAYLCSLVEPVVGVITNIGQSHFELLGTREAIAAAKAELMDGLKDDGTAVLPRDDDFYEFLRDRARSRGSLSAITFGAGSSADFRYSDVRITAPGVTEFRVNGVSFTLPVPGVHHAVNAAAACAVGSCFGVDLESSAAQLRQWQHPDQRLALKTSPSGPVVLDDSYNAAPSSVRAGLSTLVRLAQALNKRPVAVLGDMKELGALSAELHEEVGRAPEMEAVQVLVTVGTEAERIGRTSSVPKVFRFADASEAAGQIRSLLETNDLVLVKGSRAMTMEKVVEALLQE